jgi:hypothetical protein
MLISGMVIRFIQHNISTDSTMTLAENVQQKAIGWWLIACGCIRDPTQLLPPGERRRDAEIALIS